MPTGNLSSALVVPDNFEAGWGAFERTVLLPDHWYGPYSKTGKSAFFSVNSNESSAFDFSAPKCNMQLPPVWSNEILKFPTGKVDAEADMGIGGNSDDWPLPVRLVILRFQWL